MVKGSLYVLILSMLLASNICNTVPENIIFNEEGIIDRKAFKNRLQKLQLAGRLVISQQIFVTLGSFGGEYVYKQQFLLFKEFVSLFQRPYESDVDEYNSRFEIFQESLQRQAAVNKKEADRNGTASYGINKYSDWKIEEFKTLLPDLARFNKSIPEEKLIKASYYPRIMNRNQCRLYHRDVPKEIDWRHYTTRIKNQKACGSCWAFVSSEQIETYSAINGDKLVELSPQELVSCAPSLGCKGGNTCMTLNWLSLTNLPLVAEVMYPYEGRDSNCQPNKLKNGTRINSVCGCHRMAGHEHLMIQVLAQRGPLAVNVDAVSWHDYTGGIIQHHCSNLNMNHAVQIVGYNLNDPVPYYIVRNQWGSSFGEDGYLRVKYGANICGMAEQPSFIVI